MDQNRLSELSINSIESDIANAIDYDDIIDGFATADARKKDFFKIKTITIFYELTFSLKLLNLKMLNKF